MTVLRDGLLEGRRVAFSAELPREVRELLGDLGAALEDLGPLDELEDSAADAWVTARTPLHGLVFDAGAAFVEGGYDGLRSGLERTWAAVRAVVAAGFIPAGAGGKIVLIAAPDARPFGTAARDALENLARTLSVEWARYKITVAAVAPGIDTAAPELATLVAYLLSEAGDYFSGCRLELGASSPSGPV